MSVTAGERRIVSALVADVVGSTAIAEQLGVRRVLRLPNTRHPVTLVNPLKGVPYLQGNTAASAGNS